jgi:hypothetical protein
VNRAYRAALRQAAAYPLDAAGLARLDELAAASTGQAAGQLAAFPISDDLPEQATAFDTEPSAEPTLDGYDLPTSDTPAQAGAVANLLRTFAGYGWTPASGHREAVLADMAGRGLIANRAELAALRAALDGAK